MKDFTNHTNMCTYTHTPASLWMDDLKSMFYHLNRNGRRNKEYHIIRNSCLIAFSSGHPAKGMRFIIQRKAIGRVSLYIRNISHFFQFIHGMMSAECLFSSISLERAVATHSSTLAWKIPWMEKPGRLQSMGSLRVRHN